MPRFTYRATDYQGTEVTGSVTAASSDAAVEHLGRLGYQVSWLEAAEGAVRPPRRGLTAPEELAFFNSQLAAMVRTGIPVSKGIAELARDMRSSRLRRALSHVSRDLEKGRSLREAFEGQQHLFPPLYASLMDAGARSGNLPAVLLMLGNYARAVARLRRTVISTMWYPLVVIVFCLALFLFLSFFISPRMEEVFREFDVALPWVTEVTLWVAGHGPAILAVLGVAVVAALTGLTVMRCTPSGRAALDRSKLGLPLVGKMLRAAAFSRFARTLGLLLQGGVPMVQALALARHALGNEALAGHLKHVEARVAEGEPFGNALRESLAGAHVLIWSAEVAERRGDLPESLVETAQVYDVETEHRARILKTAVLPILVLFVMLFVGGIALVMLLPLVKMISSLGQGVSGF